MSKVFLTDEQKKMFENSIKVGVYKQLHKDGMLSDEQLMRLLRNKLL